MSHVAPLGTRATTPFPLFVSFVLPYLKMMYSCVHLILRDSQEVQNPEFLQKVTKETKSRRYRPNPSFPSLPSVKSERMYGFGCGAAAPGVSWENNPIVPGSVFRVLGCRLRTLHPCPSEQSVVKFSVAFRGHQIRGHSRPSRLTFRIPHLRAVPKTTAARLRAKTAPSASWQRRRRCASPAPAPSWSRCRG